MNGDRCRSEVEVLAKRRFQEGTITEMTKGTITDLHARAFELSVDVGRAVAGMFDYANKHFSKETKAKLKQVDDDLCSAVARLYRLKSK